MELVNTGLVSPGRGRGGSAALNDGQTTIPRFLLYFMKSSRRAVASRATKEAQASIGSTKQNLRHYQSFLLS